MQFITNHKFTVKVVIAVKNSISIYSGYFILTIELTLAFSILEITSE